VKTLALADGDLVATPFGHETISGALKIRQELLCSFAEPLGDDRFHPDFGSVIPNYLGRPLDEELEMLVLAEANRVLQNYVTIQRREVLNDHLDQRRSRFNASDVVRRVTNIHTTISLDTITIYVNLLTESGETVTLTSEVAL